MEYQLGGPIVTGVAGAVRSSRRGLGNAYKPFAADERPSNRLMTSRERFEFIFIF